MTRTEGHRVCADHGPESDLGVVWVDPFVGQFQMEDTLSCIGAMDYATRSDRWRPAQIADKGVVREERSGDLVSYNALTYPVEHQSILVFAKACLDRYLMLRQGADAVPTFAITENYSVHKYSPGDAYSAVHADYSPIPLLEKRHLTFILYLNSVAVGGETEFWQQGVKVSPVEGRAIIFPSGWTHAHKSHPTDVDRWIFQLWWSFVE